MCDYSPDNNFFFIISRLCSFTDKNPDLQAGHENHGFTPNCSLYFSDLGFSKHYPQLSRLKYQPKLHYKYCAKYHLTK